MSTRDEFVAFSEMMIHNLNVAAQLTIYSPLQKCFSDLQLLELAYVIEDEAIENYNGRTEP